ncbi:MAG: sigma-E processing peptidase SpoIIGA [Oscillospiraceae bacterium]|nr:sigma-E processing peptidase SpoIIGA [Oscillospiraceae bacterium]
MTVIYIDSLFILNFIINYLLLLLSARLTGAPFIRWRLSLGAALGAAYAVVTVLPGLTWTGSVLAKVIMTLPIAALSRGIGRGFPRFLALFWLTSCLLAGIVLGLGLMAGGTPYLHIPAEALLLMAAAAYFILFAALRGIARFGGLRSRLLPVEVTFRGRRAVFSALADTGHTLTDPMTGQSVLIADKSCLMPLMPTEARALISASENPVELVEQIRLVDGALLFRLIPYQAIGTRRGWLAAFTPDSVVINGEKKVKMLVAFSTLSAGRAYRALIGA